MGSGNKVVPEDEDGAANNAAEPDGSLGAAADGPAQGSLQKRLLSKAWMWVSGSKERSIDAADVQDGKDVVAFAESILPMLLQNGGSLQKNRAALGILKVLMFLGVNALLAGMLFLYPQMRNYTYLVGGPAMGNITMSDAAAAGGYSLALKRTPGTVTLQVQDQALNPVPTGNAAYVAAYATRVLLPFDGPGAPGWNLQDLLDLPRLPADVADTYYHPFTSERMVQDHRVCASSCIATNGVPVDMVSTVSGLPSRNYTAAPYGSWGDAYVNRSLVVRLLDPDFFDSYLNSSITPAAKQLMGNYGLPVEQLTSDLNATTPTDGGHLCGLGRSRRRLTRIVLASKSCFIQIASAPGDGYAAFVRAKEEFNVSQSVQEVVHTNTTSGCSSYELRITAEAPGCKRPQLIGVDRDCELSCAVILYKGIAARRVPIHVEESKTVGSWPSTLHIDDRFLVLEHAWPDAGLADLSVTGGNIQVNISNARIARLHVHNNAGTISLDHARVDTANLSSVESDVLVEDDRDTELLYRSAGNHLCAAAPLVEAVPPDFLRCDAVGHALHNKYDVVLDGYIDKDEFASGLSKLGLSFGPESLGLSPAQQQELLDHIFTEPEAAAPGASQNISPTLLTSRLKAALPPLLTLYDTANKAACAASCVASNWTCVQACNWACSPPVTVSEPQAGWCNPRAGCIPACGQPDSPVSSHGSATGNIAFGQFDVSGDGQLDLEEVRMALLWVFSNCTYAVVRPSDNAHCTVVSGPTLADPSSLSAAVHFNCTAAGVGAALVNPDDWATANERMPSMSAAQAAVYGGVAPRECRPFPDYDPRLSGRAYNASATLADCPACFCPDGIGRVPAQYYNRSTWSTHHYQQVMTYIHAVFVGSTVANGPLPYLNISDAEQWSWLASRLLTPSSKQDRVTYATFNRNMATVSTLPFMESGQHVLLDPDCHAGRFLKLRPSYSSSGSSSAADAVATQMVHYDLASPGTILDSRMPGYQRTNVPGLETVVNPCPTEWGNGTQGSTSFTWFPSWANATLGYKWGKALPAWCLDEQWPDGGSWNGSIGLYPNDTLVYGPLAGQAMQPGCQPAACKPTYSVAVRTGSIHAQVLPFAFDAWNSTGSYMTMVANCDGPDGSPRCFYKGWADSKDASLHPMDTTSWTTLMDACYADDMSCSDNLHAVTVLGPGAPNQEKWFWSSRRVYMEVEPAWFYIMSATILKPDTHHVDLRLTPGFCDIKFGAIEHVDWRYPTLHDASTTFTDGLRPKREATVFTRMQAVLNGTSPSRAGWFLKQVWRDPYTNESLHYSQSTADGSLDTQPGFVDASGSLQGGGAFYRHKRVCPAGTDCKYDFMIYRDNCKIQRQALPNAAHDADASAPKYLLSGCSFTNGSSAFLDPSLEEAGPTWNDTFYTSQFPLGLLDYSLAATHALQPPKLLDRNQLLSPASLLWNNVTVKSYTKWGINVLENGDVTYTDASNAWQEDIPLYAAIALSVVIAAMCGMAVMALVVYFGLGYLQKINADLQARAKIEARRYEERKAQLFEEILEAKRMKVTAYRLHQKYLKEQASGISKLASEASAAALPGVAEAHAAPPTVDVSDVVLSDPEKAAILTLMEEEGYDDTNVRQWRLRHMVVLWATEVAERKLPPGDYTLLPPPSEDEEAVQEVLGASNKRTVTLVIKENGPHAPPKQKTFNGYQMAGSKSMLKKFKRLLKFEGVMNKWRGKPSKGKKRAMSRLLAVNAARLNRLKQIVVDFFMYDFPSPFQVLHMWTMEQLQAEMVDSLKTFLLVKCLFDHNMGHKEQLLLGNVDLGDIQDLREAKKRYKSCKQKKDKPNKHAKQAAKSMKKKAASSNSHKQYSESSQASLPLPGPDFLQFEGHGEVVASASVDGRMELYRVKYVRIRMRKVEVQEATADEGDDGGWLVKPTKRWEVLIDEGPGVITSSKYDPDAEPQADMSVQAWSMQPDGQRTLHRRTLVLPCPTVEELADMDCAQDPTAAPTTSAAHAGDARPLIDLAARRRHYIVNTAQGPSSITVDTVPNPERGDHQEARIEFGCRMGTFQPHYDKFCHDYDLVPKVLEDCTTLLKDMGIIMQKKVAAKVKGIRHKSMGSATVPHVPADAAGGDAGGSTEDAAVKEGEGKQAGLRGKAVLHVEAMATAPIDHHFPEDEDPEALEDREQQQEAGDNLSPLQRARKYHGRRLHPQLSNLEDEPLLGSGRRVTHPLHDSDDEGEEGHMPANRGSGGTKGATASNMRPSKGAGGKPGPLVKKAVPATAGLKQLLEASSDPLAVFVRETYDITGNFGADSVDLQDMQKAYRRWCRQKQLAAAMAQASTALAAEAAAAAAATPAAVHATATGVTLSFDGTSAEPSPAAAAAAAAAAAPPALAPTPSMAALPAMSSSAAVTHTAAAPAAAPAPFMPMQQAPIKPFHKKDLWSIGMRVVEEPEAVLKGTAVNLEAEDADPKDVNKSVYLAAELLAVVLHTAFIWVVPAPCLVLLFGYQSYYQATTAISPQLTLDAFRNNPLSSLVQLPTLLEALFWFSLTWVMFCYVKLLCHYTLYRWENTSWRIALKTIFWMYFIIMVALAVAYGFEIFCWVVLGAVINPNKFLPYSVACVTMAGHTQATYNRLKEQFTTYRTLLAKIVQNGFDAKLSGSIDLAKQAQALLEGNVSAVVQDVAAAAEQTVAAAQTAWAAHQAAEAPGSGGDGAPVPAQGGGSMWPGPREEASVGGGGAATAGAAASAAVVGAAVAGAAVGGAVAARAQSPTPAAAPRRGSLAAQPSALNVGSSIELARRSAGVRVSATQAAGATPVVIVAAPVQGAAAAPGAVGGAAAGAADGAAGGGSKQQDLKTWKVFKMFAADDDSLDYGEFCQLLDYFEIHLIDEKRRKLFARVDTSGDGTIGYSEFQAAYHLLQEHIVDNHMKKAGLTTGSLILLLLYAIVVLALIFVFIFLGVAAFTGASTLGAVVNSLMTAGSGIAMNLKKEEKEEDTDKVESEVLKDL